MGDPADHAVFDDHGFCIEGGRSSASVARSGPRTCQCLPRVPAVFGDFPDAHAVPGCPASVARGIRPRCAHTVRFRTGADQRRTATAGPTPAGPTPAAAAPAGTTRPGAAPRQTDHAAGTLDGSGADPGAARWRARPKAAARRGGAAGARAEPRRPGRAHQSAAPGLRDRTGPHRVDTEHRGVGELQQHRLGPRQPVRRRPGHPVDQAVLRTGCLGPIAADGHQLFRRVGRVAAYHEQHLLELQPTTLLELDLQRRPAAAPGVQDRRHPHATARPAEEPGDLGRPAAAADRDDGPPGAESGTGAWSARAST